MKRLALDVRPGDYTIARLPSESAPPEALFTRSGAGLVSITRTPEETSVICPTDVAPSADQVEHGWRLLTVRGPLEFTLTGIMAAVAGQLAAAGVSLFAVSTFETDHVLVKSVDLTRAIAALAEAGHEVHQPAS